MASAMMMATAKRIISMIIKDLQIGASTDSGKMRCNWYTNEVDKLKIINNIRIIGLF